MTTIALHLQKGGVGKTTMAVSLAWELADRGRRTVIIDADPQGNASSWLLETKYEPQHEFAEALLGQTDINSAAVWISELLGVVPTFGLSSALNDLGRSGQMAPYAIGNALEELDADYAILDLGPGLGNIEISALLASTEIVLVMTPEEFSLDGIQVWATRAEEIAKGYRARFNYSRLIINGLNRSIRQMREIHAEAERRVSTVHTVYQDAGFRKAQAAHLPAQEYGLRDENREALKELAGGIDHGSRK